MNLQTKIFKGQELKLLSKIIDQIERVSWLKQITAELQIEIWKIIMNYIEILKRETQKKFYHRHKIRFSSQLIEL